MRVSRRFTKFALLFCIIGSFFTLFGCKGRTADNMEPTGDTIEVVIMQPTNDENYQ